jgi:hypothetical protein
VITLTAEGEVPERALVVGARPDDVAVGADGGLEDGRLAEGLLTCRTG